MKTEEEIRYKKAQRRVQEIKAFYINLMCYCLVIPLLVILNLVTNPDHLWFFYPMFGWGIGVTVHGLSAFTVVPFLGKDWEQKKIEEILEKEKRLYSQFKDKEE